MKSLRTCATCARRLDVQSSLPTVAGAFAGPCLLAGHASRRPAPQAQLPRRETVPCRIPRQTPRHRTDLNTVDYHITLITDPVTQRQCLNFPAWL